MKKTSKGRTRKNVTQMSNEVKTAKKKHPHSIVQHRGLNTTIIGETTLVNPSTGEQFTSMMVNKTAYGDSGFYKLWLFDLLGLIEQMAKGKMKVFLYMLERIKADNLILAGTMREIAKNTNSSLKTVYETLDYLHEKDIVRTVQRGVYQINSNLLFKGGSNKRAAITVMYNQLPDGKPIDITGIQEQKGQLKID